MKRYIDRRLRKTVGAIEMTVPTHWGGKMRLSPQDLVSRRIIEFGTWEPPITWLSSRVLAAGDVAIDIGAHLGYYSCLFSHLVGPTGQVHSIEVVPQTYQALLTNCHLNGCENVLTHNVAVSSTTGTVEVFVAGKSNVGRSTIIHGMTKEINSMSIGRRDTLPLLDIVPLTSATRAKLIKIDAEGAELLILKPLLPLLKNEFSTCSWLIEFTPGPRDLADFTACLQTFSQAGYRILQVRNFYEVEEYARYLDAPPVMADHRIDSAICKDDPVDLLLTRLSNRELGLVRG